MPTCPRHLGHPNQVSQIASLLTPIPSCIASNADDAIMISVAAFILEKANVTDAESLDIHLINVGTKGKRGK